MSQSEELNATYTMLAQAVEICHRQGVRYAVLSPGSRSAPLALSVMRSGHIKYFVIPDERAAAYMALGIARQMRQTVALVCTSGTAALNYGPAVAEAFFSEIPLLLLTADRPAEWLGQADNQAIYQSGIYGRHVKSSFSLPADLAHPDAVWYALRQVNEALNTAHQHPQGPVHVNVPLREPLYLDHVPKTDLSNVPLIENDRVPIVPAIHFADALKAYSRILVVAGSYQPDKRLAKALEGLEDKIVFIPDITSNLHTVQGALNLYEFLIDALPADMQKNLLPDLVISFGGPVVSKSLKALLRSSAVKAHWHIGHGATAPDTYQHLSRIIPAQPAEFFQSDAFADVQADKAYLGAWYDFVSPLMRLTALELAQRPYSELTITAYLLRQLPVGSILHLGNSLPIRYAAGLAYLLPDVQVYANRGTSGIDGSLSAAVGSSLADDRLHIIILGDMSFFYDRNALWNNYLKPNLKIIVYNNHGGGIFRVLPGASHQPEREEYFVVQQPLHVEHTALQHDCRYFHCADISHLDTLFLAWLAEDEKPAILEFDFELQVSMQEMKKQMAALLQKAIGDKGLPS